MTKLPKIVPALGLAGALLFVTGVAAKAQEVAPAATQSPVNVRATANRIPATTQQISASS